MQERKSNTGAALFGNLPAFPALIGALVKYPLSINTHLAQAAVSPSSRWAEGIGIVG